MKSANGYGQRKKREAAKQKSHQLIKSLKPKNICLIH